MRIIDFHTHAFPDELAEQTVSRLGTQAGVSVTLDGKISSLLASMDRLGIERAVVLTIATKPSQFDSILRWCAAIASARLVPFASVHPEDPQAAEKVERVRRAGLIGVKLHPYYQEFAFDEKRLFPLYERIERLGLILLAHTGFDFFYPRDRVADAPKILEVVRNFPALRLVTTHLGGWQDWDTVERYLLGKPIYMGVSFSLPYMDREQARRMLLAHPPEYILFGSDSPWGSQEQTLAELLALDLGEELTDRICYRNAADLLASTRNSISSGSSGV